MIVVIGSPTGRAIDGAMMAGGPAARVALAAARAGRTVQLVGKTGDDPVADAIVLDLARGGVGHVALLRDPGRPTPFEEAPSEPEEAAPMADNVGAAQATTPATSPGDGPILEAADVDLGIRYLTDYGVIVLAEPSGPDLVAIAAHAAHWGEARLIVVLGAGHAVPDGLPDDVIVLEAPSADPDDAFADLVGGFAAALDEGTQPEVAFRAALASDGWTGAPDG